MIGTTTTEAALADLDWLRAFAARLAKDDPDDLVQETLVASMHTPTQLRSPRAWLASVMRNRHRMRGRAQASRNRRETGASDVVESVSPDDATHRVRVLSAVVERLESLPELDRAIVVARFFDGLDATQIGRAHNLSPSTVRSRLRRALLRLRDDLDERFNGERATWAVAVAAARPDRTVGLATASALSASKVAMAAVVIVAVVALVWSSTHRGPTQPNPPSPTAAHQTDVDEPPAAGELSVRHNRWRQRRTAIEASLRATKSAEQRSDRPKALATDTAEEREQLITEALASQSTAVSDCVDDTGSALVGALILRTRVLGAPDVGTIYETVDVVGDTEADPELVACVRNWMTAFVGEAPTEPFAQTRTVTHLGRKPDGDVDQTWRQRMFESVVVAHEAELARCATVGAAAWQGALSIAIEFSDDFHADDATFDGPELPETARSCMRDAALTWPFPRPHFTDKTMTDVVSIPLTSGIELDARDELDAEASQTAQIAD